MLRVLSDLLENPRSHPFFHDWQSDLNKQTAAHLLLSVWMVSLSAVATSRSETARRYRCAAFHSCIR